MTGTEADELRGLLDPAGGFDAVVHRPWGREADRSGFVAAIVLRSLRHEPEGPEIAEIRRRSLDFLWRCRSTEVEGAFTFWPADARPAWAARVPPDVDDTVVMLAELLRHGRVDRTTVMRSLCTVVLPRRVRPTAAEVLPSWVLPGSFRTWITSAATTPATRARAVDIVDGCVNANVVALMAMVDARHLPGYADAVATVRAGLAWAGTDRARLRSLTPFYPSPTSLADAMEHAIECGVEGFGDGPLQLRSVGPDSGSADGTLCGSAYGSSTWEAPAVGLARSIAQGSFA